MAKKKTQSNKLLYWLIGGVALLIILVIVGRAAGWIGKPKEIEVEIVKAKKVSITEKVSASGTVQPVTEVKIAPEVSGEITDLHVEEGDSVTRGQVLVNIRPDTWQSQLERAEAGLSQQQANLQQARANEARANAQFIRAQADFERQEKLYKEKVISEAEWQLAKQNFEVAKNELAAAKQNVEASKYVRESTEAGLREARENLRKTTVVAPMNGVVSKLIVRKGERVVGTATMAGTEMLRIADLNQMEVRVNVNENDIVRVHVGDTAIIDVDAYTTQNKEFKGIVTLIANTAKDKLSADAITEFEVRVLILRSSYEDLIKQGNKFPFRPGMTASVDIITTRKSNALAVPLAAVTTRNPEEEKESDRPGPPNREASQQPAQPNREKEKTVVFVNDNGVAKMVPVTTGISDYDNIEILSGIQENAEVVSGPFLAVSKRLKDGDKIKEEEEEDNPPPASN